jgi:hypothetical protein
MNNTQQTTLCLGALCLAAASATGQSITLPPTITDAGGANVPNLGMQQLKVDTTGAGYLQSPNVNMPTGTVLPADAMGQATGTVYEPDAAVDTSLYAFLNDTQFPQAMNFSNTDPSGSLDGTALDGSGDPIHFNLLWPQERPESVWIEDMGLDCNSPTNDLDAVLADIVATGTKLRVQEGLDILLGTNSSGALTNKAYNGYELLNYRGRKDNQTWDPVTRNITIEQLWYDNEIRSDSNMVKVPMNGDYTITWKLRGLGDIGEDRMKSFIIDEFSAIPMKTASNGNFWGRNSWIWKWFGIVEASDGSGRKFTLEDLFAAHTGTAAAPTYQDLAPPSPQYWLRADRKFNMGSFMGQNTLNDPQDRWETSDLDLSGLIGGFLVDGTDTGLAYDGATNSAAQFNQYGNNEYAVPMIDWSAGPFTAPHFAYDSTFTTVRKGMATDAVVRYGQGMNQTGIYIWGWRVHPPRINWIESYSEGQMLPGGVPKDWRFGVKWDEVAALGVDALGDHSPEKVIYNALIAFFGSPGAPADVDAFALATDGMVRHIRDRRGLPPTDDILDFPSATADVNLLFSNLDIFGDKDTLGSSGKRTWAEGDAIEVTIHNDEDFTRYFRVVDFGTTDYQFNGVDMGRFDWKPVFGVPQVVAKAWAGQFGIQGAPTSPYWDGSALDGTGNPFYVDPAQPFGVDHLGSFPSLNFAGSERDIDHVFADLAGFSGPGFHSLAGGGYEPWGSDDLAGKATGSAGMWDYAYGQPIPAHTTVTIDVEAPRAAGLNTGAFYMFDPQFHYSAIWTMHPTAQHVPEGLND